jgi:uncharacterized alkaline shock family protein YloU
MKRGDYLIELGYGLAFLLLVIVGLFFLALSFGWFAEELEAFLNMRGQELFGALAAFSLMLALYFLRRVIVAQHLRSRVMRMGPQGPIWVSLEAIRGFVLKALEEELGVHRARVSLKSRGKGLIVGVRTSLPLDVNVTELGERIQEHVKSRIESRIGVSVERVEVFARSISAEAPAAPSPGEYTPIELSERDRDE